MSKVDRKFRIFAQNPVNGKIYTEADALLLCAKDAAVPRALLAYRDECEELGANREHLESITLLISRVCKFQRDFYPGGRVPDTVGDEIPRCLEGVGVDQEPLLAVPPANWPLWVSVSQSLPDSDQTVIVYCPESNEPIWLGYLDGDTWRDIDAMPIAHQAPVTHWMPLPEPPEAV